MIPFATSEPTVKAPEILAVPVAQNALVERVQPPKASELIDKACGMSVLVKARNAGIAAEPEAGPAKTVLALSVAKVTASVPAVVIGLPDTVKADGIDKATLETVPVPGIVAHAGLAPGPWVSSACPATPGERQVHAEAER